MKKTKLQKKCSELELIIKENTGWNKARVFVITGLIVSIITLGRVNLKKIASNLNPKESKEVNYRRLSRFFQYFIGNIFPLIGRNSAGTYLTMATTSVFIH